MKQTKITSMMMDIGKRKELKRVQRKNTLKKRRTELGVRTDTTS